jgi:hypothetical protein
MNRFRLLFLVFLFSISTKAMASPMARVVHVVDWRTVVVESEGRQTAVTLTNVVVSPVRQLEATRYLETLTGSWVLVENGNVYRSPDGLFVNGEMRARFTPTPDEMEHHAMTYFGESPPVAKRASAERIQPAPRVELVETARKRTPPAPRRVQRRLRQH